ncbi:MAG TPA: hypothetical protein VJ254_04310, partial [Streptosporangiaceae bacterium]|nr:hypothetical protein [Streptosporangiaceae bacterium]
MHNREPLTAAGIYQLITRRGRQCGVDAFPHRFRHHFSRTLLRAGLTAISAPRAFRPEPRVFVRLRP